MKIIISILALFAALVSTSSARLGETEAECEARYGKSIAPVKVSADQLADKCAEFQKEGIKVTISFWKGRAVEVLYGRESLQKLSREGILTLLTANAAGSEWVLTEDSQKFQHTQGTPLGFCNWKRKDNVAAAFLSPNNGLVISDNAFQVALNAYRAALAAAAAEAEKARLKGF